MEQNITDVNAVVSIDMHEAITPALLRQLYPVEQAAPKQFAVKHAQSIQAMVCFKKCDEPVAK